ncbi:hypothetical protein BUE80_DR006430 [Diplocarpon rosae]|nr:hypothetical protein BUE80_DR006430 [Diplocarpon rosae]
MSSRFNHHVGDASHSRSGLLTPASDNSLNLGDGAVLAARKRKRDSGSTEDLLRDKFFVKPYPCTGFGKSQSLQPLMLLPRSDIPLSYLDFHSGEKGLAISRLYEAHVKILELEERLGNKPTVLIARVDDTRALYAVELESRGLYVICKLGSWVDLHDLKAAAVLSKEELPEQAGLSTPTQSQPIAGPHSNPESNKYSQKKRLAIEAIQSMVKRPPISLLTNSQAASTEPEQAVDDYRLPSQKPNQKFDPQENISLSTVEDIARPTAAEIFDNFRTQYLEALYLSRASIPIKAAFHLDYDSNLDLNDHIAFLEGLVLSSTVLDKKYRDGVPNCVSLVDIHDHSSDDAAQAAGKTKKKKISKKMKPGKNGLYPTEEPLIRKWWATHEDDAELGAPGSSREELTKSRISLLRIRETQLQMIIILEALALRPLLVSAEDTGGGLPYGLPATEVVGTKEKPARSKRPDHLTTLIDVHIDRLCIWQSIALESMNAPAGEYQKPPENTDGPISQIKHTDNILKDFCVEVIAPFFQSRLPDRCAAINRKLGGPVVVSPLKPKLHKSSTFSGALSRPGAATRRPVPVKPGQSLKRVLTDDRERRSMSGGPNKKIALMRSATMPIIPGMKREASESPSLSSIPFADSQSLGTSRGGVLKSRQLSRREVHISGMLPEKNPRAKNQATINAELQEAILALKKPNRELAGKLFAESAEKRSLSASSRKAKKPIRNPLFQGIQISATPKSNRQKDMFADSQLSSLERMVGEASTIPASSVPRIPQSASHSNYGGSQSKSLFSSVQATPTRKSVPAISQQSMNEVDHGGLPSSLLHVRRSSAQLFTAVPDSAVKNTATSSPYGIEDTPIKRKPAGSLENSHAILIRFRSDEENNKFAEKPVISNKQEQNDSNSGNTESIYQALGWDDNDNINDLA